MMTLHVTIIRVDSQGLKAEISDNFYLTFIDVRSP